MPVLADDDVVVHGDAEGAASGGQGRRVRAAAQRLGLEGLTPVRSHARHQQRELPPPLLLDFI